MYRSRKKLHSLANLRRLKLLAQQHLSRLKKKLRRLSQIKKSSRKWRNLHLWCKQLQLRQCHILSNSLQLQQCLLNLLHSHLLFHLHLLQLQRYKNLQLCKSRYPRKNLQENTTHTSLQRKQSISTRSLFFLRIPQNHQTQWSES